MSEQTPIERREAEKHIAAQHEYYERIKQSAHMTKPLAKSIEAFDRPQAAVTQPVEHEYVCFTENTHRGERSVDMGDGKTMIQFQDGQYRTNDPLEAKFLEGLGDVQVERVQQERQRHRAWFTVPALPWKKE